MTRYNIMITLAMGCTLSLPLQAELRVPALNEITREQERQTSCKNYGDGAVEQHQLNLRYACGYTGARWNNDSAGQAKWCLSVPDRISNAESAARSEALAECYVKKTSLSNPDNHPKVPKACLAPAGYTAVKALNRAYRYERLPTEFVEKGLIRYDYNSDQREDFIFLEANKKHARVIICLSQKTVYRRYITDIGFDASGNDLEDDDYRLRQQGKLLTVQINRFMHNGGSSGRSVKYRYDLKAKKFTVAENLMDSNPVYYDGEPYPMSIPDTPTLQAQ